MMYVYGIGIDIVEVERVESMLKNNKLRFRSKLFTKAEQAYCDQHRCPAIHYAARFAAKEAVVKAFGTGVGKHVSWLDVEIVREESGEPKVMISGDGANFAKQVGISEVKISLTHTQHYAAANAMAFTQAAT